MFWEHSWTCVTGGRVWEQRRWNKSEKTPTGHVGRKIFFCGHEMYLVKLEARGPLITVLGRSCPSRLPSILSLAKDSWSLAPDPQFFLPSVSIEWFPPTSYLLGLLVPTFSLSPRLEEKPCLHDWRLAGVVPWKLLLLFLHCFVLEDFTFQTI